MKKLLIAIISVFLFNQCLSQRLHLDTSGYVRVEEDTTLLLDELNKDTINNDTANEGSLIKYMRIHGSDTDSYKITVHKIVSCHPRDTVSVLLLMCDTTESDFYRSPAYYNNENNIRDTLTERKVSTSFGFLFWQRALDVVEKHNTGEGSIDPYMSICYDKTGKRVSCYEDYWVHIKYLNLDKTDIGKQFVIWQEIDIK